MTNTQTQSPVQKLCALAAAHPVNRESILTHVWRLARLVLLFAYVSLPMWASWLGYYSNYRDISSSDMLIAMAWMPISSAIIALSFMNGGRKHLTRAFFVFALLNGIAIGCIAWWL